MTTWPPRIACTTTPTTATAPSHRTHARLSFAQSRTVSSKVRTPSPPATARCENSNRSPPCKDESGGTKVPCDVGQSVTESAASFEVTSAPATNSRIVQHTVNTANPCTSGLYLAVVISVPAANYT